jgi:general secretion pathway protein G
MNYYTGNHPLNRQAPRGFTLVEMLLVLVILGVLAAIISPNLSKHASGARITATKTQIHILGTALTQFEMDNDRFPQGRNGLLELLQRPRDAKNWRGPYLEKPLLPKDAWHRDFIYECPGKHSPQSYDIMSLGPDGTEGTADDIGSWQQDT